MYYEVAQKDSGKTIHTTRFSDINAAEDFIVEQSAFLFDGETLQLACYPELTFEQAEAADKRSASKLQNPHHYDNN